MTDTSRHQLRLLGFQLVLLVAPVACTNRQPVRCLIPEGYVGWVRVDFGVLDASPLPVQKDERIIRFPSDGRVRTSTLFQAGWARDRYFYYSGDRLVPLDWDGKDQVIWGGFNSPQRHVSQFAQSEFFFVGTATQYQAYVESPEPSVPTGPEGHFPKVGPINPLPAGA